MFKGAFVDATLRTVGPCASNKGTPPETMQQRSAKSPNSTQWKQSAQSNISSGAIRVAKDLTLRCPWTPSHDPKRLGMSTRPGFRTAGRRIEMDCCVGVYLIVPSFAAGAVLRVGSDRPGSRFCSIAAALQCIRRYYPGLESGDARYERRRQSPFDSGSGRPDSNITSIRDHIRGDV